MLRLSARLAVRRFASSRRAAIRVSRRTWLPLSLRWRRKRKRAGSVHTSREAMRAAPGIASMARFHLHFNLLASERGRLERDVRSFTRTTIVRELQRGVMSRHWTTIRAETIAMPQRAASPSQRLFSKRRAEVHVPAPAAPRTVSLLTTHAKTTQVERRTLFESLRKSATSSFRERRTERRVQSHETRVFRMHSATAHRSERVTERRTQSHEQRVFRTRAETTHRLREETTRSHVQLLRPVALVWRSAQQAQSDGARETRFMNPETALRPPIRPAVQEPAPETMRRSAQRALQANDLDPALLDRLTDDVIRRVERRVRIERERRGL